MSEDREVRGPDGELLGTVTRMSPRRPTKQSSNHHLDPADPELIRLCSREGYAAAAVAEYSSYVAVVPIVHNGVRAYNVGYPVPVSNVEKYGYLEQGLVRAIGAPAPPAASTTPKRCLSVRCKRRQLLAVYDVDPPILLGYFTPDVLRLQGTDVVAPRPDHMLAWLRAGRAAADFAESVVADAATPLQLWCPNHRQGHDLHPGLLRAELSKANKAHQHESRCSIERVETRSDPQGYSRRRSK